jgi:predicted porin
MKKTLIGAAALSVFGTIAHAQSSVTLYGWLDEGVSYANHVATSTGPQSKVFYGSGVDGGDRWGIRGQEDLGGGLKAVFTLENGFNASNGALGQGGDLFGRQAFVGLSKDGIGSITFGRQYVLSQTFVGNDFSAGGQSAVGNYGFHPNDLDMFTSSRVNNAVKLSSANFAGFRFGAMYAFSNQAGAFQGSVPTTTPVNAGASSTYSFGSGYANGPFAIGVAYTSINFPTAAAPAYPVTIANIDTNGLRKTNTFGVGASYKIGPVNVFGNYTDTHLQPIAGTQSTVQSGELGATYFITPALQATLDDAYTRLSGGFSGRWNQINSALDYSLSKRTDIYLLAIYQKASGSNLVKGVMVPVQASIGSSSTFVAASAGANNQFVGRLGLRVRF